MNANTRIVWILLLRSLAGSVNVNWLNWVHSSASLTRWYVKYIASLEFPDVRQITRNWLPSSPLYPPRLPRLFNPPFFFLIFVLYSIDDLQGQMILSSRVARTAGVIYFSVLHLLVFLVLYRLAYTETCHRDMAAECAQKYPQSIIYQCQLRFVFNSIHLLCE